MNSVRVAVLMGGHSSEREVSLESGRAVLEALKSRGVEAVPVDLVERDFREELEREHIGFAFIVLHGQGGEDGSVQRVLEKLGIPYLGSDPEACARAFNKIRAKGQFFEAGIPTPPYTLLSRKDWHEKVLDLRFPLFVKPPEEGSSIDVYLFEDEKILSPVLQDLFGRYPFLLAEEKIEGRELTVGILGSQTLPVIEIRPHRPFYDFTAKYRSGGRTEYLVPAPISEKETEKVQALARATHQALGLRDFSRIDVILAGDGPYILEANSIPGFTRTSLLPKAALAAGIDFADLCLRLISIAFERVKHEKKDKGEKVFVS